MNKRGQIFIVATFIIIGIIASVTGVFTSASANYEKEERFYDLAEEVDVETKKVIDYGVYREETSQTDSPIPYRQELASFLPSYADYIGQDDVVFVYGNSVGMEVIYFENNAQTGVIEINPSGGSSINLPNYGPHVNTNTIRPNVVNGNIDNVVVRVRENDYPFSLRSGENFFFVIAKEDEGEKFVATG